MLRTSIILLVMIVFSSSAFAAECSDRLFFIDKSTNKNIVVYDAVMKDGLIDNSNPIDVYYLVYEEEGQRVELGYLDRAKAFGYEAQAIEPGKSYMVKLVAFSERPLNLFLKDGCPTAQMVVDGDTATLTSIFVQLKSSFLPLVKHIVLKGVRPDGTLVQEQVNND